MSARRAPDMQGHLDVIAPELVLQILSLARAHGLLVLRSARQQGNVAFRAGKIVALWRGRTKPPAPRPEGESLLELFALFLGWRSGTFRFLQDRETSWSGPGLDVEGLLLDAMTRLDRARGGAVEGPGH